MYIVRLERINLALARFNEGEDQLVDDCRIIQDISFQIYIENCLGPLNKKFPSLRVFIDFDHIGIDLDLSYLKPVLRVKESILTDLDDKDLQMVEGKIKKKYKDELAEGQRVALERRAQETTAQAKSVDEMRSKSQKQINSINNAL